MTLADTQAIAMVVNRSPATVRSWAHRKLLTRRGTGPRRRALYDIGEAQELVRRLAMENTLTMCNTGHAVVPVCPREVAP